MRKAPPGIEPNRLSTLGQFDGISCGHILGRYSWALHRQSRRGSRRPPAGSPLNVLSSFALPCMRCPFRVPRSHPMLSWAISRGRCRHCGDAVSGQYSAVETLVGAGFLAAWLTSGATLFGSGLAVIHATLLAVLFTCLVIASLVDLSHWYVPRSLILLVGTAGIFDSYLAAVPIPQILSNGLLAMAAPALLKGGYRVLRHRDGLGWDDVLLFLVGGFWLSSGEIVLWWTIGPLFSVIGAVIAGVRRPRDRVPMAPGLSAALSLILLLRPFGLAP